MATDADISDLISPMKIEAVDKEHNSGNSKIIKEELIEVNEGIVKSIEGDNFLQSPSFIDGEVEKNTEDNQLNFIRKMNGSQNGDKIDMKTDENNPNPASEHTDCSQGTTFDIEKVSDVCPLKEKRDDTLTAEAILSQQDSTETSFIEEDGSQNKSSESPLTEKVDKIEIPKQELDHEAKDIVEDNLNDKSEALGNVEMLVTEASEESETTPTSETPDQNPAKEDVTTISGVIKVYATPEEKNHAAIDLDEKNEAEVAVTDNSGDDTNATSPLVVDEKQIISEKLNQVSIVETESQGLKVSEGSKGEQEGNSSNKVIQTTKHFDKNADDQTIKEEEFEEPKVTNEREKIDEDINKETLTVPAIECNREDVTIRENITVANIGDEEEPEEPSTIEEPENKIENDTEKSENVSSLVSQPPKEEVYEAKMKDMKNYAEKADTAPSKVVETTSLTEVEPVDKPLEEASSMKSHLPEHEIEKEDLEKPENLDAESESHVQAVQDVYEITRSPNVEESGANEIEKIIREVPEELSAAYNNGENGESETKTQIEDKGGLEGSDAVSESKDQNTEEIHETKTSVRAGKNEEVSENNEAETSKSKRNPEFHGIEEIKETETPTAGQIPTEEEKDELNPVPETGNTVDEIENETTDKTETELINPDADEDKEEKLSELTLEPNVQCVEGIDEIEPKPLVSQTQEGKETEELKDVPEAVFEPTAQNVEEVNETSSKADQIEKLNREAPEEFSEPTNQVVEAVNNEDTVTPTVAIALTSSKEFQLNGEADTITDPVSSEKNIEMTEKADGSQQDEGVEKIIPEDASTSVSDYAHEDVKIESESAKIDEEVGETRTPVTIYEYKDQVVEDAHETDLSSAVDESNINKIAKVEKDVTGELPEAIDEDVEAETKGSPNPEITKSIAENVQEAKASVPVIQSKALSVEEMDGFDPTHSHFQGVGTIIDKQVLPNQTLLIENKEQLMEPCSTLVEDQHHETTTEVQMVKSESINKNDTRLSEDTADLLETGTTKYEVQRELDISNSDVAVQESQNEATEKEINEESIDEKMKCDAGESKLINDQINAFGTSSETTIPETIETVDTTKQDSEADGNKIQETSNVESQFLSRENETEACISTTAENEDAENLEAENSEDHNVEEIHETETSPGLGDTETSEIDNKVREVPRVINQVYEADSSDKIAHGQKIQAENLEAPEVFSEPTNQVVEEVSNDEFTAPTVASELTSSKEFQLNSAPENVTNSSPENIETTEKSDSIQQDEGIEKIVLEDASNAVSNSVQEDEEKDSESFKVNEEVGEARTVVTSENKDQVIEHARETDLSSAVDESNVNEIANVEREIPEELPEAINEVVEAGSKIVPNQETAENDEACGFNNLSFEETREMKTGQSLENTENYKMGEENKESQPSESMKMPNVIGLEEISEPEPTQPAREIYEDEEKEEVNGREIEVTDKNESGANKSDADEIQEAKASEPVIQPKAICAEETDELDLEPTIGKMPTNVEREEFEAVPAVRTIFNDDIGPNQTLPVESKEQLTNPCSMSVKDQHHETVTEVEIVKPECTNKNDAWLNKDTAALLETGTTETVEQKELEISNSDVRVQETQNVAMEKEIDEENIEEKMTLVGESELINKPINAFGTSLETTTQGTIETFDTSEVSKILTVETQLLAHKKETEVCESFTAETDAVNLEVEKSAENVTTALTSSGKVEKDVTGELPEAVNEDVEAESEGSPNQEITKSIAEDVQEAKAFVPVIQSKALSVEEMDGFDPTHRNFQGVATVIDEEILPNQTLLIQSKEHLMEPCSTLVDDQHHETTTEVEMVKSESINKNDTRLNEDTADLSEIGTTGNVEQRELEISNSDVTVQDSQNEATEKEIDEVSIDEKMKYDEGESKLINDQINAFGTSSETTIAETIETVDTTTHDSEVNSTKMQETSNVEFQLLSRENEAEAFERTTTENEDAKNFDAGNSGDHNVEEIHETDTSPALGDTESSEIDNKAREAPRVIHQVYEVDISDEIALGQKIQAENREAPEAFSEPTNHVEEVSNDDFFAPTVATELTSSKEFQMDSAPENVTNSSAENIETTEKADNSQQDEGIVKIVLEDASTTVSDYVQEDEEKYIDEEVGEAKTTNTISEHKDQVVEVARETDLSSAVDDSNINEIAKVEKEVPEKLPEAVNEDAEADNKINLDQEITENEDVCRSNDQIFEETHEMKTKPNSEITENYKMGEENKENETSESVIEPNVIGLEEISETEPTPTAKEIHVDEEKEEVTNKIETGDNKSDADEVQEAKSSEPIIQPKAICVEEKDELDPTLAIEKMPTNEEREETEAVVAVREIFNEDISPNQTLPIEREEQLTEPCSVSVKDQHHESVTEVEILKPESINKNDTWLNENTTDLPETVVQKELEISNSDVTVQDTQSGETEKVIDEENIEEKMKCDDGADIDATTGTEVTLVGESEIVNEPINAFGTSSETTTPGTIETFDVSAVCESSTVDSQPLAHENETEVCDRFTAETDAENLEFENSEVPAAESEFLVHNVEEIHQTDTNPAVEDASTSEVENAVREVPGVINQVYEADSSGELSHDRKIQAENTVDPVQVSSFVFLPSEESHESKAVTMDDTEDGHMKKDDTEENNLKQLEDTSVDSVKAEETLNVETVTDDEANERPLVIGELEKECQESSSALLSEKQGKTEESKISETKTETNVLGVQDVSENETTAAVEETHADKVEEETKEALETIHDPKCQDIGVIADQESVSNQTFPPEIIESTRDGVEDTDIAPTPASEVKSIEEIEPSDEAAKDFDITLESKAPETVEAEGIKPEEASIVEVTCAVHENKEAHESVEKIHGVKANPVVGETDADESENVVREVPKALPEGNKQGPEADSNDKIIPGWTDQVEIIEEEVSKSPPVYLSSEESRENVTTTTENTEDESEKVTQEVLRALPEGINQDPEAVSNDQIPPSCTSQAESIEEEVSNSSSVFLPSEKSHETSTKNTDDDSLKLQETFGVLSQLQVIETKEASVADEVEAEEAKGSDVIYESKDHLDDIHETKSSPSAEISDEVNMEEATSNEAEKTSDVEAIDVPADESTSVSNYPTENLDTGANITNSADDKPEEVIISESIPEPGVLDVEKIQTETSPSVAKTHDDEEDETKTVPETTFQPDHEDVADIIARYIISNQTFPDENKEDIHKGVEETDIFPAAVVEEASIGKINPIDEVVKASCYSSDTEIQETIQTDDTTELKSEISKSQLHEHEADKIAHESVVQNVQEIQSPSLGESDVIGSVNIYDNEETKNSSSVTEPKEHAVEDIYFVVGADMNESDQETREAPKKITKEINQDAGEVGKEEDSAIQHTEVENIEEMGFVFVPEAKDQSFEEARDTKAITAAKTPNIVEAEEDGTQVLEQIYGETYTGVEASVDGQTQATRTVPEIVFEANDQDVGEIISKDIDFNDIVQNESKPQQNEPCLALLKDQDQETVLEDGVIKAEDKIQTDASSNENAIDSFEAGTEVEKSSSKPVDESKDYCDLEFEEIEKPLHTDSENIPVSKGDPIPKVTDVIDEQLEKSVASTTECESETRIESTTEAAQAIHEITSKETLTEEPEKAEADNPLGEPITADNSNVETPKQVSVGTKSTNSVYAEEDKNEKYAEDKPITEIEGTKYENLETKSTRSIEEVKGRQVTLGKPEDKLGDYNEKDETGYTNINNFENRVEKEKMENESPEPACEKNGTKGSVGIAEQEPTANVADFPSIKITTYEELAVKDEIMVDEKQRDFILDPVPIHSSTDEKVKKLVMLPTTNNQESLGDVTEPSKAIMEPQEEEKISLSLSQAQIAKKEYLNEEKENKNAIASKDIQVIQEAKHGEEIPEAIEKMTPDDPAGVSSFEILHKPADQTKQITEEPKTETVEKGLVEEEKTDEEEENEQKRADSDAPVMVEASRDIDVKTPTKKSHNILSGVGSKVKHSIAKVKKAITGKSSNQKSSSPKEGKKTEAVPLL